MIRTEKGPKLKCRTCVKTVPIVEDCQGAKCDTDVLKFEFFWIEVMTSQACIFYPFSLIAVTVLLFTKTLFE